MCERFLHGERILLYVRVCVCVKRLGSFAQNVVHFNVEVFVSLTKLN